MKYESNCNQQSGSKFELYRRTQSRLERWGNLHRNVAAALNRADLLQREGSYPPPPGCPEWPGLEVAGIVKEVAPDVTKWKVGDKVCALLGGG